MIKKLIKRSLFFLALFCAAALIVTACKQTTNFFEAISRYGFKSKIPLGAKTIRVDPQILGGYVYKSVPVIIAQKDEMTYEIRFLSVELDKEDVVLEAYTSEIAGLSYLNLDMGESWAFLKFSKVINNQLAVNLLRNTVSPYVEDKDLPAWLAKNGRNEEFSDPDSMQVSIWYEFVFEKVTVEKAYELQASELQQRKTELFESCDDYSAYEALSVKYPNDPLLSLARENLFGHCKTMAEFEAFIQHFPSDPLCVEARKQIEAIRIFKSDSTAYRQALATNTISAFRNYSATCQTQAFRDSATLHVHRLANNLSPEEVEWKWTGGERQEALKMILDKIDYADADFDPSWWQSHIALYCIMISDSATTEKGLAGLDKLVLKKPTRNQRLDMYLSKGFMLWSMKKNELAIEVFRSRITETYDGADAISFRKMVEVCYQGYKDLALVFPAEKKTWKKIKKL